MFGSTGLTRWWSKPASVVRRRSSCWPQPVSAASTDVLQAGLLAQSPGHFVAVHARHPDVEEHHLRSVALRQFQGGGAVVGHPDLVALQPQQQGEAVGGVHVVIDHQQPTARR